MSLLFMDLLLTPILSHLRKQCPALTQSSGGQRWWTKSKLRFRVAPGNWHLFLQVRRRFPLSGSSKSNRTLKETLRNTRLGLLLGDSLKSLASTLRKHLLLLFELNSFGLYLQLRRRMTFISFISTARTPFYTAKATSRFTSLNRRDS